MSAKTAKSEKAKRKRQIKKEKAKLVALQVKSMSKAKGFNLFSNSLGISDKDIKSFFGKSKINTALNCASEKTTSTPLSVDQV